MKRLGFIKTAVLAFALHEGVQAAPLIVATNVQAGNCAVTVTLDPLTSFVYGRGLTYTFVVGTTQISFPPPNPPGTLSFPIPSGSYTLYTLYITFGSYPSTSSSPGYPVTVAPCRDTYWLTYFTNGELVGAPDATVYLTNPGTSGGDICAMIYVLNPSQQLLECCGCLITPDGLLKLSVNSNLTSNPLTPETLTSGTIKVISSAGAPTCDPSKPVPMPAVRGWGTHIQAVSTGSPSPYLITETDFQGVTLSTADVSHLQRICSSIVGNGSGYGVCSCGLPF